MKWIYLHEMDLFFHIFDLCGDVSILAGGLGKLPIEFLIVLVLIYHKVSILELHFDHVLPQYVVIADLTLQTVDLLL